MLTFLCGAANATAMDGYVIAAAPVAADGFAAVVEVFAVDDKDGDDEKEEEEEEGGEDDDGDDDDNAVAAAAGAGAMVVMMAVILRCEGSVKEAST